MRFSPLWATDGQELAAFTGHGQWRREQATTLIPDWVTVLRKGRQLAWILVACAHKDDSTCRARAEKRPGTTSVSNSQCFAREKSLAGFEGATLAAYRAVSSTRELADIPFFLMAGGGGGRSETERLGGGGKMGIQRLGHSFSNRDVTDIPLSASAAGTINVATSLLFLFCWVSHALDLCKTIHSSSSDLYGFFKYRERGRGKTP